MTRLTRAKKFTRMSAVAVVIVTLLLVVGRLGFKALDAYFPDPRLPQMIFKPDVALGPVPTPVLPTSSVTASATSIRLDLVEGEMPEATSSATLYRVGKPALSLSAQDRARARAGRLEFTSNPTQPSPTTFRWTEGSRVLTIDLEDQNFTLATNQSALDLNTRVNFSRFDPVKDRASQFIKSQFTFLDLDNDNPQTRHVLPAGNGFQPQNPDAVTPSHYLEATVLRQPLNGIPVYSTRGKYGPITFVAIPAKQEAKTLNSFYLDQVIWLQSTYQPIDKSAAGTYPVITPQQAFEMLQSNFKDYVVSVQANGSTVPSSMSSANVQFIQLVYLEPDSQNREIVQPAWMFEGRGSTNAGSANWVAYVPAVDFAQTQMLLNPAQ